MTMQSEIDSPWFEEDDPETIEICVGIEGVGTSTHEIPRTFLEQEFTGMNAQRRFIEKQLTEMALMMSIEWGDQQ